MRLTFEQKKALWAYGFLIIPCIFYLVIRFFPTFNAFYISLTSWDIVSTQKEFIGIKNYAVMIRDPIFWQTLLNTIKYLVYGLPISLVLSFIIAYFLNKIGHGLAFFRTLYFIPYITSLVAVSWVWRWLYQAAPIGAFNNLLIALGLPQQPFLMSIGQALPSILAPTIWAGLGFQVIIYLAGLKGIPLHYYDAAAIDGANKRQQLFRITIPLLRPVIIFLVVTGTILYLRIFTQVLNMTFQGEGGPLNSTKPLVLHIYNTAFKSFEMGYAAAMTVVLFVLIMIITLIQLKVMRKNE